ncbi:MAG TPA: lyase family protein, partial [Anaerolineae bacterium]
MPNIPIADTLSPLDGRYANETAPLREYFSEFAFIRQRARIEIDYLLALSHEAHLVRTLTGAEEQLLRELASNFSPESAREVKEIERTTRHDVKAIEYFLRARLLATSLADVVEWLHFGLTSEDINLTAQASALRDSRDAVILPALDRVIAALVALARQYRRLPMLARTHGQPAVPTTLGKELAVFYARLKSQRTFLNSHRFQAKLNGAVGNWNALAAAVPQVDWIAFSRRFVESQGLESNLFTTQLLPYENWLQYFD